MIGLEILIELVCLGLWISNKVAKDDALKMKLISSSKLTLEEIMMT